MTEVQSMGSRVPPPVAPNGKSTGLEELRRLLLVEDRERVDAVASRLETVASRVETLRVDATQVGQLLPEAIKLASQGSGQLVQVLSPTVREAIDLSVRENPKPITEAIFPIIGPAIRRAIAEAFARVIQTFNQTLEQGLSAQALKWRWQAMRTGKPFADVVLYHTLVFRVEQVFLIHGESGLLLLHAVAPACLSKDASVVSGMLTAIADFVKDSFRTAKEDSLHTLEVGELNVWIESGPKALVAAVIRGNPPVEFRETLRVAVENIHAEQGKALREFSGDPAPFEACHSHLHDCLREMQRPASSSRPRRWIGPVVLSAIGLVVLLWLGLAWRKSSRWQGVLNDLRITPGLQVTEFVSAGDRASVRGLRDPLAPGLDDLLARHGFKPQDLTTAWESYASLSPSLVEARAVKTLKPPASVSVRFEKGVLTLRGAAPAAWVASATALAATVTGVEEVRTSELLPLDPDGELLARARTLLRPPSTVELKVLQGMVHATGSASHNWIVDAERLVQLLPAAKGLHRVGLIDLDWRRLEAIKDSLEQLRFYFKSTTVELEAESKEQLLLAALRLGDLERRLQGFDRKLGVTIVARLDPALPEAEPRALDALRAEALTRFCIAAGVDPLSFLPPISGEAMAADATTDEVKRAFTSFRIAVGG